MTKGERFAALLSEVGREVMRRRASDACCGELTLEQFETLRVIDRSALSTIGTLSKALKVDVSTMSRNVAVLDRNGYLRRGRSLNDGRIVQVMLTAKGQKALRTLQCGERDVLGDVYERIAPRERLAVMKALESLRGCLVESDGVAACCAPSSGARASAGQRLSSGPGGGRC